MTNTYTARWFDLFLRPITSEQTAREVAFLCRVLPRPTYRTLLDVCCGPGRHAHLLAEAGYIVFGVDRDATALAQARSNALPHEQYLQCDMRQLRQLNIQPDAVLCLWQSFGYFDAPTNRAVLHDMAALLPNHGRCILDLNHHDFFVAHQGSRIFERHGATITETSRVENGRLYVTLTEANGMLIDSFEWQLFTPDQCIALGQSVGLSCVLTCTNYDEQQPPTAASPRVQYVFEKA